MFLLTSKLSESRDLLASFLYYYIHTIYTIIQFLHLELRNSAWPVEDAQ